MVPKMVSAVEDPASGFVYVGLTVDSLSQPAACIPASRSHASLSIVFCFQNADTYVGGAEAGPIERLIFCSRTCFCNVFSQVAG